MPALKYLQFACTYTNLAHFCLVSNVMCYANLCLIEYSLFDCGGCDILTNQHQQTDIQVNHGLEQRPSKNVTMVCVCLGTFNDRGMILHPRQGKVEAGQVITNAMDFA